MHGERAIKESLDQSVDRVFCQHRERACSKGRHGSKGEEWIGDEGGARFKVSATRLREAAIKADEDIAVRGRSPMPENRSDS